MIKFYPRPRHTREGDRNLNPDSIALIPILRHRVRLAIRLRATPAVYRSSTGFPTNLGEAASADFSDDE